MKVKEFMELNDNKGEFNKQLTSGRKMIFILSDDYTIATGEDLELEQCLDRKIRSWFIALYDNRIAFYLNLE